MKFNQKFNTFKRVVRTGATNFVRNAWLAMAAMAVMVVTLTIILFSLVASATFNNTIAQITSKINISVYLKDSVTEEQRTALMDGLRELPNVKSVGFVSKDQALAEYKAANSNNPGLLQALNETSNPLPASVKVLPHDPSKIQDIKNFLDKPDNVALLDPQAGTSYSGDRKAAIDKITHATNVLQRIGVAAVMIFAVISMLIIFNTIQMAIFNRRDELTIMRLLGATTWYIRGPFVVESIIYGVISAVLSILIINAVFITASSALQASSLGLLDIGYANTYFHDKFWILLTMQLVVGIVIGAVSSIIATRRYLKFKTSK
jgi:cell division transport system permease protein